MKAMVLWGLLIWASATVALRLGGQFVFRSTGIGTTAALLVVSLPVMVLVAFVLLRRFLTMERRAVAAIVLVAPGMLLDTASAIWFSTVFPNIRADAAGLFGGWLLFCNVVVLLTAISLPRSAN